MIITLNQLSKFLPGTPQTTLTNYLQPIKDATSIYKINNSSRFSAFIAQVAHESQGFKRSEENLNYSADRLMEVFKGHFKNLVEAKEYEYRPQDIANRVYANRYGNGTEDSGDGWKYRGRGPLQLTFKGNYIKYSDLLNEDFVGSPGLVAEPEYGMLVAGAFWSERGLNDWADKKDLKTITRKINGGLTGYRDRLALYKRALKIF